MGKALVNKSLSLVWEHKNKDGTHQVYFNNRTKQYKYILTIVGKNIVDTEMYKRKSSVIKAMNRISKAFKSDILMGEMYKISLQ